MAEIMVEITTTKCKNVTKGPQVVKAPVYCNKTWRAAVSLRGGFQHVTPFTMALSTNLNHSSNSIRQIKIVKRTPVAIMAI